jgi:hypothetical protein
MFDAVSKFFDPRGLILRPIFFIDRDRTIYVSVGFYPARNYDVLVEFGRLKLNTIVLAALHVRTLAEHLRICEGCVATDITRARTVISEEYDWRLQHR